MNDAFLRCTGVVKRYGRVTAVGGADLVVERGHTMALLGPSGCGKTTLLRAIAGFEIPDGGVIELGGRTLNAPGTFVRPEKRQVGMVFQDFALFPHMSVGANVAFGIHNRGGRRERIDELLTLVGLGGLGDRMPHQLSGGQQQRVALARSLAAQPELILLDEPFSNLDPGLRQRVREEVRRIIESLHITAVFVTHDQEEALSVAERVAVMLDGRIHQAGRPAEVYSRPASRAVAEFLGDANFLAGEASDDAVQTELGRISAPVPGAGGAVEVMVRPESLSLAGEGGEPAHVVASEYYGHDQMVTVRLDSGTLVKVREISGRDFPAGKRLGVRVSGDVVVYPRSPEAAALDASD